MEQKLIHKKMSEAMKSIGAISKNQTNTHQRYKFRGIDDVYNALNKPLSDAGIYYVPEVLGYERSVAPNNKGTLVATVVMKVKYTFYAEDGSSVETTVYGEAFDTSDKATNKALTAALKYAVFQIFCIATENSEDADSANVPVTQNKRPPAPQKAPVNNPGPNMLPDTFVFKTGPFAGQAIASVEQNVLGMWAREGVANPENGPELKAKYKQVLDYLEAKNGNNPARNE